MPRRVDNVVFGWLSGDQYQERRRGPQRDQFLPVVRGTITMTVGSWTEEDVKNGLREPSGALVGGLVVLDYAQGHKDYHEGAAPPPVTSASYDLGRRRALEEHEARLDALAEEARRQRETDQRIRELLKDRPDLIAEYEAGTKRAGQGFPRPAR